MENHMQLQGGQIQNENSDTISKETRATRTEKVFEKEFGEQAKDIVPEGDIALSNSEIEKLGVLSRTASRRLASSFALNEFKEFDWMADESDGEQLHLYDPGSIIDIYQDAVESIPSPAEQSIPQKAVNVQQRRNPLHDITFKATTDSTDNPEESSNGSRQALFSGSLFLKNSPRSIRARSWASRKLTNDDKSQHSPEKPPESFNSATPVKTRRKPWAQGLITVEPQLDEENKENDARNDSTTETTTSLWRKWRSPPLCETAGNSTSPRLSTRIENDFNAWRASFREWRGELKKTNSGHNLRKKLEIMRQELHSRRSPKMEENEDVANASHSLNDHSPLKEIKSLFNRSEQDENKTEIQVVKPDNYNEESALKLSIRDNKLKISVSNANSRGTRSADDSLALLCESENISKTEVLKRMKDGSIKTRSYAILDASSNNVSN